jgi:hypothetical protein
MGPQLLTRDRPQLSQDIAFDRISLSYEMKDKTKKRKNSGAPIMKANTTLTLLPIMTQERYVDIANNGIRHCKILRAFFTAL